MDESGNKWPPETPEEVLQFLASEVFVVEFRRCVTFLQRSVPGSLCPDLAEDAAMDTLLRFIERSTDPRNLRKFDNPTEFVAYFFKACHNRLLDIIKSQNRRRELLSAWSSEVAGTQFETDWTLQVREMIETTYSEQTHVITGLTKDEHDVLRIYLSDESVAKVEASGKQEAAISFVSVKLGIGKRKAYRLLKNAKSKIHDYLRSFE